MAFEWQLRDHRDGAARKFPQTSCFINLATSSLQKMWGFHLNELSWSLERLEGLSERDENSLGQGMPPHIFDLMVFNFNPQLFAVHQKDICRMLFVYRNHELVGKETRYGE
ncbi:hypothetical protein HAX54_026232 [Datura stramonium]|uniref:Uncharacterized protein n=1 Tax=Datura stramonium TaxID=4076 RepID=A0ABS8S6V8_DATST|nr:hypothetical protein [Datura stramonium]